MSTKIIRIFLQRVIRKAKNGYYNSKFTEAGTGTRKIWRILNEVIDRKQCRKKIPKNFEVCKNKLTQPSRIANGFNDYFASIGTEMAEAQPNMEGFDKYLTQATSRFILKRVTIDDVEIFFLNQRPKLGWSLDTIINKIVKTCHNALTDITKLHIWFRIYWTLWKKILQKIGWPLPPTLTSARLLIACKMINYLYCCGFHWGWGRK